MRLRADYVRLCEITCNSHNYLRRVMGVNYWKEQFKLLASYEGLHADYVRLCEITCRLCEIMCNSHNYNGRLCQSDMA